MTATTTRSTKAAKAIHTLDIPNPGPAKYFVGYLLNAADAMILVQVRHGTSTNADRPRRCSYHLQGVLFSKVGRLRRRHNGKRPPQRYVPTSGAVMIFDEDEIGVGRWTDALVRTVH